MHHLLLLLIISIASVIQETEYSPSTTSGEVTTVDAEFAYGEDDRKVPLRVYLPDSESAAAVILFSHGLGGARTNNPYLGKHWAGRGYAVIFMQHAGSDEIIWKEVPRRQRMKKMKQAANAESFQTRVADVSATLDQLEKWNQKDQKLAGRLNLEKVGMSGHSFGAVTTQAVSGQRYMSRGRSLVDDRIIAAIAMSPSPPKFKKDGVALENVKIPWMLMTGTKDKSIITRTSPEDRLKVFAQLPKSDHFYQLVLNDAEHMAFSDRTLTGNPQRNANHHKTILALSSAFWDAYLKEDAAAMAWLDGEGAKKVLDGKDQWQRK